MLRLEHVSKIYPIGEALRDVSWEVKSGERIGLVGANGSGKTTQFRIIMGETEPSSGEVIKNAGIKIALLSQEFDVIPTNTVHEELLRAFKEVHEIKQELHDVQHKLETATAEECTKLLIKLDRLQRAFEAKDGYGLELKVDKILPEIGFSLQDADRIVSTYSGGWQMRLGLGKVMLQEPHVLLLDEPTNHIDLETIEWLEGYLRSLSTPMVIVSHDRHFLDRLCTSIVEVERGVSTTYLGNYTTYITTKEEQKAAQLATYERQQKELERQQAFVDRFRASAARSTQAKSREKQLDKIELVEAPEDGERTLRFRFPTHARSGREVAVIENLTHIYDDKVIFLGANLLIERGDRIALLGPNGSGKSTLLRLLMGKEEPHEGSVKLGEHNIVPAYFEQNQAEALDLEKTLINTIADEVANWKDAEIRGLLGRFLFSDETVFKQVKALSGGEKARLALAKMLLRSANLLVLDEPTNHLDIPAKEMIEEAILQYDGTVVVISHDRYFISKIANRIIAIEDGQLVNYPGNYEYYLECKEKARQKELTTKLEAEEQARLAEKRAKQKAKELAKKSNK
ncbi:MAG: ATP-binding cassette domain-containing protein [Candidatus Obscuribacterales bacterium]|nr:ATP-binding cassette domain-containing protein [Candidatus Obscuribacterales bacterium]